MPKAEVTSLPTQKYTEGKHNTSGFSLIWKMHMPHKLARVTLNNIIPWLITIQD